MKNLFHKASSKVANWTGSPYAFLTALLLVLIWGLSGPLFNFSTTWQLLINTATTISTFLMVFLIQNTQNREGKAMQLKLDELIVSTKARDSFVNLEDLTDEELEVIDEEFKRLHSQQTAHPALHKLHGKISQEHQRRQNYRQQATNAVKSLWNSHK